MEKEKLIKDIILVFTRIMRQAISPGFIFPGGGAAARCVTSCIEKLKEDYPELSQERIVDFCICQVYAISRFPKEYVQRWKVTHSFGAKALTRFKQTKQAHRYYEDKWLKSNGLNRYSLLEPIRDRSSHPLYKYIYPDYEDKTKARVMNTDAGYYICGVSTLLWSPLSPVCRQCTHAEKCKERTQKTYPELYRLREELSK